MAELSFPLENTTYGAEEAQLWFSSRTSGVFAGEELIVSESEGMRVMLGKGRAWMAYAEFAGVVYANTVAKALDVMTSDAYFDRIDRVVIRFDRTVNTIAAVVVSGEAASEPVPPAIVRNDTRFELSVAQIRVKTGVTEITSADITDERFDAAVCGLMKDGVTSIGTSGIEAQWRGVLAQLKEALDSVQDGSVVKRYRMTLNCPVSGWVEQEDGSYTQMLTAAMFETDSCSIDVDMSAATVDNYSDIIDAWGAVTKAQTQNGGLLLTAFDGAPKIDFVIKAEVYR